MRPHFQIHCLDCGFETDYHPAEFSCPRCASQWREARYDIAAVSARLPAMLPKRAFNLWRYEELLPIETPMPDLTLGAGGTPLIRAANLGLMLGNPHIYIKDERQGPTGSFKDRQAALTIAALKEAGITELVIASTGNVAIAYSALAARSGIRCWAFLTSLVPAEKMREVALYGTQVIKVTATYDQAKQVAAEFARQRGFYLDRGTRSISSVEAMKTIAFECTEQLSSFYLDQLPEQNGQSATPWRAPDWYIQSVSGGIGPVGVLKGFRELKAIGLIDKVPKLGIIQAEGCSPMVQAWKENKPEASPVVSPRTHIATLATGDPGRSYTLLYDGVTREAGGTFESVSDDEAFRALHVAAKMEGMSIEPASGVAFAGLIKLARSGLIKQDEVVVDNCSGHTMPVEPLVLGERWAKNVVFPYNADVQTPEEGLLAALSRVTDDRFPRVLVVDDHPDARRLILRILQSQGNYDLQQASSGLEALEMSAREKPDLIILDLMMPEMDGFSVLDHLKERAATADIPVIVVTAKELTLQEKERLSGRIQSLMQKGSFMDDDLLNEIQALIK
jgi:threonine synthase